MDDHVTGKDDPQGLIADDRISERSRLGIHRIIVSRISHHIDLTVLAANGALTEPIGTIGEPLAVLLPVGVAPPAVVDWVAGPTRKIAQLPSGGVDGPGTKKKNICDMLH